MVVSMSVCVCVKNTQHESEGEGKRQQDRWSEWSINKQKYVRDNIFVWARNEEQAA